MSPTDERSGILAGKCKNAERIRCQMEPLSKYYRYSEELTFKSVSLIIIRQFIIETNLVDVSSDVSKHNKIKVKIQLKRYTLLFFLHMNMG